MNTEKTLIENENQLSCLGAVSGSIHVTDGRTERYRQFHSASKWFDECEWFQLIDDMNGTLTIKKCMGIEIPKNAQKFTSSRHFMCISEIPLGRYEIEEDESTIDELVVYYR
jgi:hypothetical protein